MRKEVFGILLIAIMLISSMLSLLAPSVKANPSTMIDEWPMFHHDPMRSGHSTSPAPLTNSSQWISKPYAGAFASSPAVVNGRVFIGSEDGKLYALDANYGALLWSFQTGPIGDVPPAVRSSSAVAYGKVFVGAHDGKVYALSEITGALVWSFATYDMVTSSPSVHSSLVFIVGVSGVFKPSKVFALNERTGRVVWSSSGLVSFPGWGLVEMSLAGSPAVADGKVFVSANEVIGQVEWPGGVFAFDENRGNQIWSYETGGSLVYSPAVANGKVFVNTFAGKTYALNATNGSLVWTYQTAQTSFADMGTPAIADGMVFVQSDRLYALNEQTGDIVWSYPTGGGPSSPAIANGVVFVGSGDGKIYALNEHTGDLIWYYQTPDEIVSSPAIYDGSVYIGGAAIPTNIDNYRLPGSGAVYAFGIPDFYLTVSPPFQRVNPAQTASYTVLLQSLKGFSSSVSLSLTGLDAVPDVTYFFDPTSVVPSGISTLTITTSSATPMRIYDIVVTGTSGDLIHSARIQLIVGWVFEVGINSYYLRQDLDPSTAGVADPYFEFTVSDISGSTIYGSFRSPNPGFEPQIEKTRSSYVGPIYSLDSIIALPARINIQAWDYDDSLDDQNDPNPGPDLITTVVFNVETLPLSLAFDQPSIYMRVNAQEVVPTALNLERHTNDPLNQFQWYWFEVSADLVWSNYLAFLSSAKSEITVAVLDTGVDYTHPELSDRVWVDSDGSHGYDYVDGDNNPMDQGIIKGGTTIYHGTMVASVIAAEIDNGIGIAGIAPNAKIMPLRVVTTDDQTRSEWIEQAIYFAVNKGAKVVSISLRLPGPPNKGVQDAINYAYRKGVAVVAAMGNDRTSVPFYPASYDKVISVSAIERSAAIGSFLFPEDDFSSYSLTYRKFADTFSNHGTSEKISAPGVLIQTANASWDIYNPYPLADGTSFSTPIVSAIVALILGYANARYDNTLSASLATKILKSSCIDLGASVWDPYYGWGMVNAQLAIQKVDELVGHL